jgi:hypothetical protein
VRAGDGALRAPVAAAGLARSRRRRRRESLAPLVGTSCAPPLACCPLLPHAPLWRLRLQIGNVEELDIDLQEFTIQLRQFVEGVQHGPLGDPSDPHQLLDPLSYGVPEHGLGHLASQGPADAPDGSLGDDPPPDAVTGASIGLGLLARHGTPTARGSGHAASGLGSSGLGSGSMGAGSSSRADTPGVVGPEAVPEEP